MSLNYALPRFKGNEPLLEQLTATRLNAILDAVDRARVVFGDNITGTRAPGGTIIRARAQVTAGESIVLPFEVSKAVDGGGDPALAVAPGMIAGLSPYLNDLYLGNVQLDNNPAPVFTIFEAGEFSLFLRGYITADPSNLYRSSVTVVEVTSDDDPSVVADIDPETSEVPNLKVFWSEGHEEDHTEGRFYIKIADITVVDVEDNLSVTEIIQQLFNNYTTFVVAGDEVIIVL